MNKKRRGHRDIGCRTCQSLWRRNSWIIWWNQDQHLLRLTTEVSSRTTSSRPSASQKHQSEITICLIIFPNIHFETYASRRVCRRNSQDHIRRTTQFCDIITANHRVLIEEGELQNNQRFAIDAQDLATQLIQSYPCKSKTSQKMARILRKFIGPEENPKVTHTCNSLEFGKVCEDLRWNDRAFKPYRPVAYGTTEQQ